MQMFVVTGMQQSAPRTVYLAKSGLGGQASKGPSVPAAMGASGPRATDLGNARVIWSLEVFKPGLYGWLLRFRSPL